MQPALWHTSIISRQSRWLQFRGWITSLKRIPAKQVVLCPYSLVLRSSVLCSLSSVLGSWPLVDGQWPKLDGQCRTLNPAPDPNLDPDPDPDPDLDFQLEEAIPSQPRGLRCAESLRLSFRPRGNSAERWRSVRVRSVTGVVSRVSVDERRDPDPLGDRARRRPGGRSNCSPWSMTSCASWPPSGWPTSLRARRSRPRPWSTKPIFVWLARRRPPGTAGGISSRPPPRPCAAS